MQDETNPQDFQNPQSDGEIIDAPKSTTNDVNSPLGVSQPVPSDDQSIEPDENLQGYQDDLGTGDKTDVVQEEQGDQATEFLGVPENELKKEFDGMAMDEQEYSPDQHGGEGHNAADDIREHVEDMDEGDKDRSTDSSWTG